jgi:hypothetical protein
MQEEYLVRLTRRGLESEATKHGINVDGVSDYELIEKILLTVSSP